MKIKKGFRLREICGEKVVIAEGKENIDFCNIISLNSTAAFLWEQIEDCDFDAETLTELLKEHYEVDDATAEKDAKELLKQWSDIGLIE